MAAARALVLDCSLTLAWYLEDERTDFTEAVLDELGRSEVWLPALWMLEFPNALIVAVKRGRISDGWRCDVLQRATLLPLKVDAEQVPLERISNIATRFNITTYDAAYLELAMRRKLKLATLDKALVTAANSANHPVLTETR
ncbi:MAG: type II toxin-antitoxin system VapC family toxin [Gammaproteobacteria bacterium]